MINNIVLVGRLVRDVELKHTTGGHAVANFTLACDRPFKNASGEKETDFIRVIVWRKQAENCAQYLGKGSMAGATGRLQVRNYEANDGQKKTIAEVVADNVRFLDSKKQQGQGQIIPGDEIEISDEDVPF